ncbi:UDP-glucose 4-epimerase GalE [Pullulanibacillus camelliae]|uniref:UDP-glucose 4-epimerase n=1 Tax=Pullulanibacillus camelliae TaxID=1707096 RepID=A0A8J2YIY7_9BACL|nr:UDP-glucose 4-epimerase GalE [Pullulanibacillus camelliae]GGE45450.1 UDP-glucose 4-epimerase GalE [Pullulanibacillus camelliae]
MTVLVTGGAGYIGSHTVLYLKQKGLDVVVYDNLLTGHRGAVQGVPLIEGDLHDEEQLKSVFDSYSIDAVVHFAASSLVGESVQDPLKYYDNNVAGTLSLLKQMIAHDVKKIVFSSTAATYGEPQSIPIKESDQTAPTNPYGETKLAIEKMFKWSEAAYGLKSISLRYFNAAGADPDGTIGEDHKPESHLIPIILQVALGQRDHISIFGNDYPTEDGTCIRDYIHVMDLAQAHYLALKKLEETNESGIYNLGNGQGFSVRQVINACRRVTGKEIKAIESPRRSGDPAELIATSEKAEKELGWQPVYTELDKIVEHAWAWHSHHPNGYEEE